MHFDQIEAIIDSYFTATEIPIILTNHQNNEIIRPEALINFDDKFYYSLLNSKVQGSDKIKIISYGPYIFLILTKPENYTSSITLGPFLISKQIPLSFDDSLKFQTSFQTEDDSVGIPPLNDGIFSHICFLFKLILNQDISAEDFRTALHNNNPFQEHDFITDLVISKRDYEDYLLGYKGEKKFLRYIEIGDSLTARILLQDLEANTYDSMEDLSLTKYRYVSLVTLITRTVISVGVALELAFSTSDIYIKLLNSLSTFNDVHEQLCRAIISFCKLVNQNKNQNLPPWIKNCKNFIMQNLHSSFSLNDIADFVHLSPNYLSTQFKQYTGTTLQNYINSQKILEAKYLLQTSSLSIAEISDQLNFGSASYFTKVFKKHTGTKPSSYLSTSRSNFIEL